MDRKPYVIVQGRSDVGLPGGNGNGNEEKANKCKVISEAEPVGLGK